MTGPARGHATSDVHLLLRQRAPDPPPLHLAVIAATAYLEVRAGQRSVDQLTRWVDARTARLLAAMVRRHRRHMPRPCALTLRRVHIDESRPDRPSLVVLLDDGARVIPVCVEVRRRDGCWTVTTLAIPDDHRPADIDADQPDWEVPASVEPW